MMNELCALSTCRSWPPTERDSKGPRWLNVAETEARGERMMEWLRRRMTYANVMSTLAVFIALGGSSYAAVKISGANIKNRSIAAKKLKANSLTGREVRETRLARVPHAAEADRLGGFSASQLRLHCPIRYVRDRRCVRRAHTPRRDAVRQRRDRCLEAGGSRQQAVDFRRTES